MTITASTPTPENAPPQAHPHPVVRTLRHDAGERPFIVIWEVTRACGLVCRHCRAEAQRTAHPDQLTTGQGLALLDDLAAFGPPRPIVVLTGGDPFERGDLAELVAHGTEAGLSMSISPSVTPRLTAERLAELRSAGARACSVSLDGARPSTHDAFRGFTGTFDATLRAAAAIRETGLRLQVNTTITRGNVAELPRILSTVMGMSAAMWYVFFLVPTGRGSALEALTPADKEDVLHWLHDNSTRIAIKTTEAPQYRRVALQRSRARQLRQPLPPTGELHARLTAATFALLGPSPLAPRKPRAPMAVNAGSGFAFVDHLGDVYPSGFLPLRCGNVTEDGFREIYRTAPLLVSLRHPEGFGGKCGVCEFHSVCGGSRSYAYAVTGDPLAADPSCGYLPDAWSPTQ
ncbi:MAG: TIGR04053 family radical SAM/SPASM domain-containing protein [Dermatophilaceae bacterium]